MAEGLDNTKQDNIKPIAELMKRPQVVKDALGQPIEAVSGKPQTDVALGKAVMFAAIGRRSSEGPKCSIGAAVVNQPVLRVGAGEV